MGAIGHGCALFGAEKALLTMRWPCPQYITAFAYARLALFRADNVELGTYC